MLILSNTTDKIQVILTATVSSTQLDCIAIYRDTTLSSITPLRNVTATNNATAVNLVDSPSASNYRSVDYLSVYNSDTSTSEVHIEFSDNGTNYTLFKSRISPGEKIEYQEGFGFKVISNKGSIKSKVIPETITDTNLNMVILRQDAINSPIANNAYINVPELGFAVKSGKKYWFRFLLFYSADATTTGSRWFIDGSSATTFLTYKVHTSLTSTTLTITQGANIYEFLTTSNATSAATDGNSSIIEGFVFPDIDGRLSLRFATEVTSGTITLKKNSILQYKQTST